MMDVSPHRLAEPEALEALPVPAAAPVSLIGPLGQPRRLAAMGA